MIQSVIGLNGNEVWLRINNIMNNSDNTSDRICWEMSNQQIFFTKDKECIVSNIQKFIECYTNDVGDYKSSWELALIYSYNLTLYLIKNCDIKAENITYIGYGFSSRYKNSSNVIVFYVYDK